MLQQTLTHALTESGCVNQRVYQCLSSGRGARMTNKTSGTVSAAVTGAWQEMPESLTPSEGWGATGLIRTSCHLWQPPWQTREQAWETVRSGTSWQSDPGPVAAALAPQCHGVQAWETSQGHRYCLPGSTLCGREDSPRNTMWTTDATRTSSSGWAWPWNLQLPWMILLSGMGDMLVIKHECKQLKTSFINNKNDDQNAWFLLNLLRGVTETELSTALYYVCFVFKWAPLYINN